MENEQQPSAFQAPSVSSDSSPVFTPEISVAPEERFSESKADIEAAIAALRGIADVRGVPVNQALRDGQAMDVILRAIEVNKACPKGAMPINYWVATDVMSAGALRSLAAKVDDARLATQLEDKATRILGYRSPHV